MRIMRTEDLKNRTKELLEDAFECALGKIDHAINSGGMNVEDAEDNYLLPKILAKALLQDAANSIAEPVGHRKKVFRREVDKIYALI